METNDSFADDELLCEIDVELVRPKQSIYIFQYPVRPFYRSYDENSFTNARIKEKLSLVEMDLFVDCQSSNYFSARGKQFAESCSRDDGKQYFNSDRMDKQTLMSTNTISGEKHWTMRRKSISCSYLGDCYLIGLLNERKNRLILCPLKSILQLRPQFNYLDPTSLNSTVSSKENPSIDDDANNLSDAEQSGSESEDVRAESTATLVTMKFARKESEYHKKKRLQSYNYYRQMRDDERWQDLICLMNKQSHEAQRVRREFFSRKTFSEQQFS